MNKKYIVLSAALVMAFLFQGQLARASSVITNNGTIQGEVEVGFGNCLPGKKSNTCNIAGASRIVYALKPVLFTDMSGVYLSSTATTTVVAQTVAGKDGTYSFSLPAGTYSIFVSDNNQKYCNSFGGQGEACQVTIVGTSTVDYDIDVYHYFF